MRQLFMGLAFIILISSQIRGASVEYRYSPADSLDCGELTHMVLGKGVYVSNSSQGMKTMKFFVEDVKGSRYLDVRLYLLSLVGEGLMLQYNGMEPVEMEQRGHYFTGREPSTSDIREMTFMLPEGYTGIVTGIKVIYYDEKPRDDENLIFSKQHEEFHKGYIKVSGFGRFGKGKDASVRLEAERAAKVNAQRNLELAIRQISLQEGHELDLGRLDAVTKGARVIKKEYIDDGVVVTIAVKIQGNSGYESLVKR